MSDTYMGCSAEVTITLRVRGTGHWGKDATVEEVMRIGGRETISAIEHMVRDSKMKVTIVAPPVVTFVTWERLPNE